MDQNKKVPQVFLSKLKIIWSALFVSVFVHAFISEQVGGSMTLEGILDFTNPIKMPLYMAAMFSLVMSFIIPKVLLKKTLQNGGEENYIYEHYFTHFIIKLA